MSEPVSLIGIYMIKVVVSLAIFKYRAVLQTRFRSCATNQVRSKWQTGDGGMRVDRKGWEGLNGWVSYFNKYLVPGKGFLFLKRRVCYFNVGTMSSTSTLISVERHQMRTFGLLMWVWLPYCCRLTRDYRILLTQSLFLTIES